MKKICNVLVILIALLFASSAWAAGTITGVEYLAQGLTGKEVRQVIFTVTFGADASAPAATALDAILKTNGLKLQPFGGWWLLEVSTLYGTTAPTDNTDLYLYRAQGTNRIDVLGGNGANTIDNATDNTFTPATTTRPLLGTELLTISGNAVNNATCTIVFTLYR